jgi:hypothetical protein
MPKNIFTGRVDECISAEKSSVLQMAFLGIVSILVGIVCLLDATLVYGLPFIMSISESATTGSRTGMLLPFALGCMFTYCIAYTGYTKAERIIVKLMAVGFLAVAMQICDSHYVDYDRVGLLGLSPAVSGIVHSIGALLGFGLMWVWIMFFFTKSGSDGIRTRHKRIRNKIYYTVGLVMLFGIFIFVLGALNFFEESKPYVWLAEEILLIPAGFALLVKSGVFVKDK